MRLALLALALFLSALAPVRAEDPKPVKIMHVMSYHTPWRWTDGQLAGFKEGLNLPHAEYKVFQMDTKRHSGEPERAAKGQAAREIIDRWKPDLIYTTDDDAQEHVSKHYLNTPIKQVFSGVNKAPETYGFDKAENITGVLEHEHFVQSVRLLKSLVPELRRLVVVLDDAPMWGPVVSRIKAREAELPEVKVVAWETIRTFEEYKQRIAAYPAMADGIALLGVFNFKDAQGKNVPYQEVLRWTAEHSRLPDLGFWIDRVYHGTLAAVTVSEREQGLAAGRLARQILVDGKSPASLPMKPTTKGLAVINLARAKALGIKVKSQQMLTAEVVTQYEWDKKQ